MRTTNGCLRPAMTMKAVAHRINADLNGTQVEGFRIKRKRIAPQCSSTMASLPLAKLLTNVKLLPGYSFVSCCHLQKGIIPFKCLHPLDCAQ